ncbi:MAG TPA: stage V sporulation protein AB [Candidatus Mediterraneibacter intestinipullorum]|nr:stage V sporulation protein AB [Candidatus Mediterraneibacter intestinipullorum]
MWAQWGQQILLAVIGVSAGVAVAGGLFAFIVELGVVADFADRTHTADKILLYESSVALGGILGNLVYIFRISPTAGMAQFSAGQGLLGIFAIFAGIFVGCWSMALAEILNVFPVFMRRARIVRYIAAFTISVAIGKGLGSWLFFFRGW